MSSSTLVCRCAKNLFGRRSLHVGWGCCLLGVAPVLPSPAAAPGNSIRFSERLVWNDFSYGFGVQAFDVDGDGLLDLTAADTAEYVQLEPLEGEPVVLGVAEAGNNFPAVSKAPGIRNSNFYWFRNNGRGDFERKFITRNDLQRRLERHLWADLNGDGRGDVVVVDNQLGDIVWYENPGPAAVRGTETWRKRFVAKGNMLGAVDLAVADFDGDGWTDVAAAGWRMGNNFRWFKNPGREASTEWSGWTIDGGYPLASCIVAGDIDGDSRPDVFTTSGTSRALIWYRNPGNLASASWTRNVVDLTPGLRQPARAKLADLNGDGRLDAALAWGGYGQTDALIVWYENAGMTEGRVQWKKRMIGDISSATDIAVGDLNGDGRPDIAAIGFVTGDVAWFEHPGNAAARWTKYEVKRGWPSVNQVVIADLDGDGRGDLAAIADYGAAELRWWRNDGLTVSKPPPSRSP